jgi:N-acyl-D-amino-acid deacylase
MYDIIIKNGTIVDGTGSPGFKADLAIKDDRIRKIGELQNEKGELEIDAKGKIVCPGFIDVNNHSDTFWQMFSNPHLESLVYQGITTIIGGNCGSSLSPLATPSTIESIQKWINIENISFNWLRMKDFFNFLEKRKISVNFATLVGHATLRRGILGNELRELTSEEFKFIEKILNESIAEGALGISTGLVYTHARLASKKELVDFARIIKKHQGVYVTHIRDEAVELVESIEEAVEIGKETGVKLHISHLKAMGEKNWKKMDEVLKIINKASREGVEISFDIYPYTNTGSVLYTLLPSWVAEGGKKAMLRRLKDPSIRAKVILEMKESEFEYEKVEIMSSPLSKAMTRKKITEIAFSQNKSSEEAIVDILIASEGRVISSMEVVSEDNIRKSIKHPLSMIASNGAGYDLEYSKTGEGVHPRSFGTFIKIFDKYVFGEKLLSFEKAVRKMTSYPAQTFGIKERGILKEGYFADVLILDKNKISSPATKEKPYQYCQGVQYSFVNGEMVIKEEKYQEVRNGRVIRR